jgi:hypothetical protein
MAAFSLGLLLVASGCETVVTSRPGTLYQPLGGRQTGRVAPDDESMDAGTLKTTSTDIVRMTDKMVRSMLSTRVLANRDAPPTIICDSKYFKNLSNDQNVDTMMLATRVRTNLNRVAKGRMVFVARHGGATRVLDDESVVRGQNPHFTVPADYRLIAQIHNHSIAGRSNYMLSNWEMVDTTTGVIVWSDAYEFKKAGSDPIGYDR